MRVCVCMYVYIFILSPLFYQAITYGLTRKDCDDALLRNTVQTCRAFTAPNSQDSQNSYGIFSLTRRSPNKVLMIPCKRVNTLLREQNEPLIACANQNNKFLGCIKISLIVYDAVRILGGFFYSNPPEGYCNKPFIPNCLPVRK